MQFCFLLPILKKLNLVVGYGGKNNPYKEPIMWYLFDKWMVCEK